MALEKSELDALQRTLETRARVLRGQVSGKLGDAASDAGGMNTGGDYGDQAFASSESSLDLAEAVCLVGHEGEIFDAVVIDEGEWGVEVQIAEPAVLTRLDARRVDPGDDLRVRLVSVDLERFAVEFERVS